MGVVPTQLDSSGARHGDGPMKWTRLREGRTNALQLRFDSQSFIVLSSHLTLLSFPLVDESKGALRWRAFLSFHSALGASLTTWLARQVCCCGHERRGLQPGIRRLSGVISFFRRQALHYWRGLNLGHLPEKVLMSFHTAALCSMSCTFDKQQRDDI